MQVTLGQAARRTGLAAFATEMRAVCGTLHVPHQDNRVDLSLFAGQNVTLELITGFEPVSG